MTLSLTQYSFASSQNDGAHLLITGGVHGDEFESIAVSRRLVNLFESADAEATLISGRVTLVPIVNAAAFLRGHRCADDGLDLARTCPGREDGSVTEQTAHALTQLIESADLYVDLHTGGTEFAVWPLAGYVLHKDQPTLETQRRMARAFNLPFVWGTAGDLDGRSLSVARDANVPAIYCEYLGSAQCDPAGVDAYFAGCLNLMREFGLLERFAATDRVTHVVEDSAPNSGHMQVCNQAPMDGYFEPCVQLGEKIETGQVLGTVHGMDGTACPIAADKEGILLVLRTFPRVLAGDSIGVVAEI
jgi:predicted deacylase